MKIDNRDIFEQIGNVFYAVAADQHLKPLEAGALKSLISKDWLPRNHGNEPIVSNETHCIIIAIDALEGSQTDAKTAFRDFNRFYQLHPEVFTQELKQRILDTALEITEIFKADNPLENGQFVALKKLLALSQVAKT